MPQGGGGAQGNLPDVQGRRTHVLNAGSGRSFIAFFDSLNGLKMLVVVQMLALAAFMFDLLLDIRVGAAPVHILVEALVLIALMLGLWLGVRQLRVHLAKVRLRESAVAAASGELANVVAQRFQE